MSCHWTIRMLAALAVATGAGIANAGVQATDDRGEVVSLAMPARRIVSLAPHATELLFAAGAGERVVGVIATSDWPPEARRLPKVGDSHALDLERIVALEPDLVVTWPYTTPAHIDRLRARGIPVFMTDPKTIEGIAADIERLGALAGSDAVARAAAADFRGRLGRLGENRGREAPLSVFYEIWPAPMYTIGGNHLITQALEVCGGTNVFAKLPLPAPTVSVEAVLAAQPEAIVAGADGAVRPSWLDDWKRWRGLPAVAYGNLLVVDANLLHRDGPRFLDGVAQLCAALDIARGNRRHANPAATR
jgi:iron complex transport system substrate-binding protein